MALLTPQDASAGLANVPRVAATGGGDTIGPGMNAAGWSTGVFLLVQNGDATATTVTVDGTPYVVPATTGLALVPVKGVYPDKPRNITYSKVTSLTVAAVQIAGK